MALVIKQFFSTKAGNLTCQVGLLYTQIFKQHCIIPVCPHYFHTFLHCKCFVIILFIAAVVGCGSSTMVTVFWTIPLEAIKINISVYKYAYMSVAGVRIQSQGQDVQRVGCCLLSFLLKF